MIRKAIFIFGLLVFTNVAAWSVAGPPIIGIYGGGNNETQTRAPECGVDALYPSIHWHESSPWMAEMTANAHRHGIKVYPSLAPAYDGYQDKHYPFAVAHPQFWERRRDGTLVNQGEAVN